MRQKSVRATTICCLVLFFTWNLPAQTSFDPSVDTIATTNLRGLWKLKVPEKTLIASAQAVSPDLSSVYDLRVQDIHGKPYLFFRGIHRQKTGSGYTIMVQLIETAQGIWKAGDQYQACWGAACSACGFDEYWGCSCERYDGPTDETAVSYCNHMIALGMGLAKVNLRD